MQTLRGIAVSPGIAIGPALVLDPHGLRLPPRAVAAEAVAAELDRLDRGLDSARAEAEAAEAEARERLGPQYADILAAHARMIADPTLRRDARDRIERRPRRRRARRLRGPRRPRRPARRHGRLAPGRPGRRRPRHPAADPRPVPRARRPARVPDDTDGPIVVLAHDLSPSETAGLDPALRARLRHRERRPGQPHGDRRRGAGDPRRRRPGQVPRPGPAQPDRRSSTATRGWSSSTPTPPTLDRYRRAAAERTARFEGLAGLAHLPAETLDGCAVELWGNIEFPAEVDRLPRPGGRRRRALPDRVPLPERRPAADRGRAVRRPTQAVVRSARGRPVTIRTLDLGADKLVSLPERPARPSPTRRWACGASGSRSATRRCSGPSSGRSSGPRPGRRPGHVPAGLDAVGEFRQARAILDARRRRTDRRGGRRPRRTCPSA